MHHEVWLQWWKQLCCFIVCIHKIIKMKSVKYRDQNVGASFSDENVLSLLILCTRTVCHLLSYKCVCVCMYPAWHFFSLLLPNNRWCLRVLPVLSSSISSQHVMQHATVPLKRYFTTFSSLILDGGSWESRPWLETGNHQRSLIVTTVCLKAVSATQQSYTVVSDWSFLSAFLTAEAWKLLVMTDWTQHLDKEIES